MGSRQEIRGKCGGGDGGKWRNKCGEQVMEWVLEEGVGDGVGQEENMGDR